MKRAKDYHVISIGEQPSPVVKVTPIFRDIPKGRKKENGKDHYYL